MTWLLPLPLVPALAALACVLLRGGRATSAVLLAAVAACAAMAVALAGRVLAGGEILAAGDWLHADALSALVALVIGTIALASGWYGTHYMAVVVAHEREDGRWAPGRYEALFLGLVASLMLAAVANNLGLMWIAIEGGTLCSALLVGYYRRPGAVEAGWKYLLLGSVAISLALFATVLLYYSAGRASDESGRGLLWTVLRADGAALDPRFVKLAFIFALVGYGAKAGLAPMHSWLPDAYTQAPTPVAALMSTGFLAASLGALLRFHAVTAACVGEAWSGGLLALFGVLSIVMAVPFLLVQGEYKRLLAYSSIENAGLVALAVGLGTPLAAFAGLFHLCTQALAKSLAFMVGGTLGRGHGSRRMDHWSGVLASSPAMGTLLIGAGLGLAGLPPAATFASEWLTLAGGFASAHRSHALVALVAVGIVFMGLAFHFSRMAMGAKRDRFVDPLPPIARAPLWLLFAALFVLGVWLPAPLRALIEQAARVVHP